MNARDYQNAFGKAPESFERCVAASLRRQMEENAMAKKRIPVLLVAILTLALLAGAAYAAVTASGGLQGFFTHFGYEIEVSGTTTPRETPLATARMDGYHVEITEALADGRWLYVAARVLPEDSDILFGDPRDVESLDARWKQAQAQGKRPAAAELQWSAARGETTDYIEVGDHYPLEDGSLACYGAGALTGEVGERIEVQAELYLEEYTGTGEADVQSQRVTIPFVVEVESPQAVASWSEGAYIEEAGITIERVTLTRTRITTHFEVEYRLDAALKTGEYAPEFHLVDATGEGLPRGATLTGEIIPEDELNFTVTGSLTLDEMPARVYAQAFDYGRDVAYEPVAIDLTVE